MESSGGVVQNAVDENLETSKSEVAGLGRVDVRQSGVKDGLQELDRTISLRAAMKEI